MNSIATTTELPDPQRRRAWALLSRAAFSAPGRVARLVRAHGPLEAANQILDGETDNQCGSNLRQQAQDDLSRIAELGGRLLTPDDPHWPARLHDLDALGPHVHPPVALWVRGPEEPNLLASNMFAVVGTSASSGYGDQVAQRFAVDLARRGWTVLSSAGFGIASAAHRATLAEHAPTVAVLSCGIDRPYLDGDQNLLAQIANTGLVISQYPPGTAFAEPQIPERNRIVAALSRGVLVCEMGLRGTTRSIVDSASALNRPVAAVPGQIDTVRSAGCHEMIRSGRARLVTSIEDILDAVPDANHHT